MAKQKKAAKKVMNRKSMKRTKGGALNAYLKLTGETQGKIKGSVSENQLGTIIKGVGSD